MNYTNLHEELQNICILKGFSKQTIKSYHHNTKKFLEFLDKSRLNLSNDAVKSYSLTLDLSINSMGLGYASVRFFFPEVLKRSFTTDEVPIKKKEKILSKVISKEKIKKIIESTKNLKHKLIIKLLYSSGLRLQELIDLKRRNIDFDRNLIYVIKGKGKKVGIKVTPHMLRHSFATHLLEQGTNIRHIQRLLGHSDRSTTERYTKVSNKYLSNIKSSLDNL